MSKVVRDQVLDKLSFTFEDLGAQKVKNIARPVEVYRVELESALVARPGPVASRRRARDLRAVITAGVLAVVAAGSTLVWRTSHHDVSPAPPTMSVGVMPLVAPSGDPAMAQLADALTRDVISMFTNNSSMLRAVPGPAGQPTLEGRKGVRTVAAALNVRFLVEGQIRPGPDVAIVALRLLNGLTGEQVGSETFSVKSADPTNEVMRTALFRLRDAMADAEVRRVMTQPRAEATAIDYVLLILTH